MEIKCKGEPDLNVYLGMTTLIIICSMGIGFIIIFNLASILTGIVLISYCAYMLSRVTRSVTFSDKIIINHFYGRSNIVEYSECKKMYKTNDGMIHAPINIIKYIRKGKDKKITFVCDDSVLEKICNEYFNGFIPKSHNQ